MISHNKNKARQNIKKKNKAIERNMIWIKRMKKLIKRPRQSYCPNIGTNIFFNHKPGKSTLFPLDNSPKHQCAIRTIPFVYHQSGKYITSIAASMRSLGKIRKNIIYITKMLNLLALNYTYYTTKIYSISSFFFKFL